MATRVGGLFISMALDMAEFDEGMTTAEQKVAATSKLQGMFNAEFEKSSNHSRRLASEMLALAGAGSRWGSMFSGMVRTLQQAVEHADKIIERAKKMGVAFTDVGERALKAQAAMLAMKNVVMSAGPLVLLEGIRIGLQAIWDATARVRAQIEKIRVEHWKEITGQNAAEEVAQFNEWEKERLGLLTLDEKRTKELHDVEVMRGNKEQVFARWRAENDVREADRKRRLAEAAAKETAKAVADILKEFFDEVDEIGGKARKFMQEAEGMRVEGWKRAVQFGKEHLKAWRDARDVARSMKDLIVGRGQGVWGGMLAAFGAGRTAAGPSDAVIQGIASQWTAQSPQQVGFGEMVALLRRIWEEEKLANKKDYQL
jgi:hypothetical protein